MVPVLRPRCGSLIEPKTDVSHKIPVIKMRYRNLLIALLLGLSGCATQGPSVKLMISGGEKITLDMSRGGVVGPEIKELKVGSAGYLLNSKEKKGFYIFSIEFKADVKPQSIKIEDVSDKKAQILVDDPAPKLTGRIWRHDCPPVGPDDPGMGWVHEIDDSFRTYRYSVTLSDGRFLSFYHVAFYPSFSKIHFRKELGLDK